MDEKIAFYFTEDGEYAPKEGLPFKKRHNVAAIIKYEKQYLFLTWLETNYSYSLVTGGILFLWGIMSISIKNYKNMI